MAKEISENVQTEAIGKLGSMMKKENDILYMEKPRQNAEKIFKQP